MLPNNSKKQPSIADLINADWQRENRCLRIYFQLQNASLLTLKVDSAFHQLLKTKLIWIFKVGIEVVVSHCLNNTKSELICTRIRNRDIDCASSQSHIIRNVHKYICIRHLALEIFNVNQTTFINEFCRGEDGKYGPKLCR